MIEDIIYRFSTPPKEDLEDCPLIGHETGLGDIAAFATVERCDDTKHTHHLRIELDDGTNLGMNVHYP